MTKPVRIRQVEDPEDTAWAPSSRTISFPIEGAVAFELASGSKLSYSSELALAHEIGHWSSGDITPPGPDLTIIDLEGEIGAWLKVVSGMLKSGNWGTDYKEQMTITLESYLYEISPYSENSVGLSRILANKIVQVAKSHKPTYKSNCKGLAKDILLSLRRKYKN